MQIDTEHLHYWMCAIRDSEDPKRVLEAFWRGQIVSKEWLITNLENHATTPSRIDIFGGWYGVLASMLFQSKIPVKDIRSIDIDPKCQATAILMNKEEEMAHRFYAVTADMVTMPSNANIVINTSCEHINQEQYDMWLSGISLDSLVVLQSNNYRIAEHIRTAETLEEFVEQSHLNVLFAGELPLPLYKRFMIIGRK
jgi:hypothetical protein